MKMEDVDNDEKEDFECAWCSPIYLLSSPLP